MTRDNYREYFFTRQTKQKKHNIIHRVVETRRNLEYFQTYLLPRKLFGIRTRTLGELIEVIILYFFCIILAPVIFQCQNI